MVKSDVGDLDLSMSLVARDPFALGWMLTTVSQQQQQKEALLIALPTMKGTQKH